MKTMRLGLALQVFSLLAGCLALGQPSTLKFRDENLSPETRAADLVSRLSLPEKVRQMQNAAPAIPRLGVPAYEWWNEGLHGVARAGLATVFPQAIGLAASFDTALERRIAETISTEARAKYNDALRQDNHQRYYGLTFWSPNINIFRDPRWGRGQETFGEDPYLTSQLALAFIHGMQGDDPKYLKTIATAKHFAVHSGPEVSRHQFDARVSKEELDDTYLYAFRKSLAAGGAASVMCAYNSLDGSPACASDFLLKEKLRTEWKFSGYVVSDCGAVSDIYHGHKFAGSMAEAAAKAVKAGTDLTCGNEYVSLIEAVQKGFITEEEIDQSLRRLFVARFRLGLFDAPSKVAYSLLGLDQVANEAHARLALEAAEKSIVLLKNENHLLPLSNPPKAIAVIGPAADDPDVLLGNYYGTPRHLITPLAGIQNRFAGKAQVRWSLGSVYADSALALVPNDVLTSASGGAAEKGVLAEYFNNEDFSGQPVLKRVEPRGYFVWAMHDQAVAQVLPAPSFAVRWSFSLRPPVSGEYALGLARQECDSCPGTNSWRLIFAGEKFLEESGAAAGGPRTLHKSVRLDAGKDYPVRVEYVQHAGGSGVEFVWAPPADAALAEAVKMAQQQSDLIILCLGLNSRLEGEESPILIPGFEHGDRTTLDLPAPQEKLLKAILDTGKPVVVVLLNGSALSVNTAQERAAAILEAWYGGQEGGAAIANTLAGDNNPAGRLPVTFYQATSQLPDFDDYSMKERTYRFFHGNALYPFGYGLSYSSFEYSNLSLKRAAGKLLVSARLKNTSQTAGDEVAQLYVGGSTGAPWLQGFARIHLAALEARTLHWELDEAELHGNIVSVAGGQPRDSKGVTALIPNP